MHRRDTFKAEKILVDRLMAKVASGNIILHTHRELEEILGDDMGVNGMRLKSTNGQPTEDVAVAGVFIAIGHKPNTDIFAGQLEMNGGYLKVQSGTEGNADSNQY